MNKVTGLNQSECSGFVMTNPVAFVLLESAGLPEKKVLIETLRDRHPGLHWDISTAAAHAEADDLLLIRIGDHLAGVLLMRAPTPINQSAWQQASSDGRRHRRHWGSTVRTWSSR
jgi:hypothetical protein